MHGHHWFSHVPHFHFFRLPEEVSHFYILAFIRTILTVTGGLFLPLYIYKATGSLFLVFLYLLLSQGLAKLPFRPLNLYVLRRFGVEWATFLSILLAGTEYMFVYFLGISVWAVLLYSVLEGISDSLYWDAYHTSFGVFGRERDSAEEVAGLQVLQNVASIILPFFSAVLINALGFNAFYALVFVGTLVVSLLLLFSFGSVHRVDISFSDVLRSPYRDLHLSDGVQYGFTWVIPIYVYILFGGSVVLFGALKTAIGAAMAAFSFIVARYFDRRRAFGLGRVVYTGNAVFAAVISLLPSPLTAAITEVGRGLTNTFAVAVSATFYRIVKHRHPALTVGRSFYASLGKSVAFLVAVVAAYLVEHLGVFSIAPLDLARCLVLLTVPFALISCLLYGRLVKDVVDLQRGEKA